VAICRLKRVAADYKSDIKDRIPSVPKKKNGKHIALIGAGPASLSVARDLLPLGYEITLFEKDSLSGGAMRTQIPRFRLPAEVLEEELHYILDMGVNCRFGEEITSMKTILKEDFDAIFVGTGAPLGKHLDLPGYDEAKANIQPKRYVIENGKLAGMEFEKVKKEYDENGRRLLIPTGENPVIIPCEDVLCAIGQDNSFPWIERDLGIEFDKWELPILDKTTFQSTNGKIFFGGDAALGPDNIITAVAHGHDAALSIHLLCNNEDLAVRPNPLTTLDSQKMGIHQWSYDNDISNDIRYAVPHAAKEQTLNDLNMEVELGFDEELAFNETMRCFNCDVQTVFTDQLCIECDACVDICPTDCITFTENAEEPELRKNLLAPAQNLEQDIYVSDVLKTGRIMAKGEDLCLHCGLCAERCPTSAWDMRKYLFNTAKAADACQT